MLIIIATLILGTFLTYFTFSNYIKNDQIAEDKTEKSQKHIQSTNKRISTKNSQEIKISEKELKNLISKTPAFNDFPEKGKIGVQFFDGNGKEMKDQMFLITKNEVKKTDISNADFIILTGNYWIPDIKKSNDFCEVMKEIKEKQDYRIKRNIGVLEAGMKYKSLMKYQDCFN